MPEGLPRHMGHTMPAVAGAQQSAVGTVCLSDGEYVGHRRGSSGYAGRSVMSSRSDRPAGGAFFRCTRPPLLHEKSAMSFMCVGDDRHRTPPQAGRALYNNIKAVHSKGPLQLA